MYTFITLILNEKKKNLVISGAYNSLFQGCSSIELINSKLSN